MNESSQGAARRARLRAHKQVRAFLSDLGGTTGEVAARLSGLGVQGVKGHTGECPIARLLVAVVGSEVAVRRIRVWNRYLLVTKTRGWRWVPVKLPAPVTGFVATFDAGNHPQLVQGNGVLLAGGGPAAAPTRSSGSPQL